MFLNQVKKDSSNKVFYFIGLLVMCLFFGSNIIGGSGYNTKQYIEFMEKEWGQNLTFLLLLLPFAFLLLGLVIWVLFSHKKSIKQLITSREKVDFRRIFVSFFLWAFFMCVLIFVEYLITPNRFVYQFDIELFIPLFFIALIFIPIQTTCEELMFRSYMTQGIFSLTTKRILAWLVPSFLFGLMHISNPEVASMGTVIMIYYIGTGLFLGAITLLDEGAELAIGFHAANNLIGSLLITSSDSVFRVPSIFRYVDNDYSVLEYIIIVCIVFPLFIYIFSKLFRFSISLKKLGL